MNDHVYEAAALDIQDRIAAMSDAGVRTAFLASNGCPGVPWVDALAQAMKDRNIDTEADLGGPQYSAST
jgi:hypothetical protein